jgi:hypothetical protein
MIDVALANLLAITADMRECATQVRLEGTPTVVCRLGPTSRTIIAVPTPE